MPPGRVDVARWRLFQALSRLKGSRDLVVELAERRIPPLVVHALEGQLTEPLASVIAKVRKG